MIQPTERRLTWLFTALLVSVVSVVFAGVSAYYHFGLLRHLEAHLSEEAIENIMPFAEKGDWAGLAKVVESEYFQVLDPQGSVVGESSNPVAIDPPVNAQLLQAALAGGLGLERVRLGGKAYLIAYVPVAAGRVGRAIASLEVVAAFDRNIAYLGLFGLPLVLALAFGVSRWIVARVMIPIRDVFTYQQLFSANVSHELLSPLTALKGGMEVALRRGRPPEEYRAILADGLQQADRMADLLRDLEMLATAQFRPADLLREPVELRALVDDGVAARRAVSPGNALRWNVEGDRPVECSADRALVNRVLENLFDNAAKYAPPGTDVHVAVKRNAARVRVQVANACAPLPEATRSQFFAPFSRAPGAKRQRIAGRGLGLYLARYIARSHGGELSLEAGPETEFRITLTLPVKPQPPGRVHPA